MKILLTMNLPYTRVHGGANRSNRSLIEGLAARGHVIRAVVPALATPSHMTHDQLLTELAGEGHEVRSEGGTDVFRVSGVEVHAVVEPARLRGYLIEQLRSFEPDWVLVSSEDQSQSLLDAALKTCPTKVVYLAHTPQMFPFGRYSLYPGAARTELIGQAAAIVTISKFVADYIKECTGFDTFTNHPPHFGSGPFPFLADFDRGYVLLMNASGIKGITIFLELARTLPHVEFAALTGYGTTASDRAALSELSNVTLLKNQKHLDDILQQTRVLLMPSLWVEGFGMAATDAMLRGIPVLASNFGGLVEAKLGTDYLLPVNPITRFEEQLEDNLLPSPVIPTQDVNPWREALTSLLTQRELYEQQARLASTASLQFVSRLSVTPFEELLLRLNTQQPSEQARAQARPNARASGTANLTNTQTGNVADLTPEQKALLILRLRKKNAERATSKTVAPSMLPVRRDRPLPLSFAQQRLWFIDQLEPGTSHYNLPAAVRLRGPLHLPALARCLTEIQRRHEVLRTHFGVADNQPVQVIAPPQPLALPLVDLCELPAAEREAEARRLAQEEAERPFDLGTGPLLRVTLLRLGEAEHICLLTLHHIVSDGWSVGVLIKEVAALYEAYARGDESPLAELGVQYADFAVWQREWLEGEVLEEQLAYWRAQLEGAPPVLELPADRPRPAVRSYRGGHETFRVSEEVGRALKEVSQRENVTLFMTLLAAFQVLLMRYSGQGEIVVGTPIAGRTRAETEGLIGFFVNMLVLRTDLSGQPTFIELLKRVREVTLGAYAHQDLPFEKLVEELQPERSLSHAPIFQVMFVLQHLSPEEAQLTELELKVIEEQGQVAKFDLTLSVTETAQGLIGSIEYSTDLFQPETIRRMAGHYESLLQGIVSNAERRLSELPLLTEDEQQALWAWNETGSDYERDTCVHEIFERQAEARPEAVAVVCDGAEWTYREVNQRANRLAHYLRKRGARREEVVGVMLERGVGMVVSLLGVLKAGGAYLPLDPAHPQDRLTYLLQDAGAALLLTEERLAELIPEHAAQVVKVDAEWDVITQESEENPHCGVSADNLVYVIYTSGSTGQPKGVCVLHRALVNHGCAIAGHYRLEPSDRVLQFASISFDVSAEELFASWGRGATVVLMPPHAYSPHLFSEFIEQQRISVVNLSASYWYEWIAALSHGEATLPHSLRLVVTGSEKVSSAQLATWQGLAGEAIGWINAYGPTEATITTTIFEASGELKHQGNGSVPIGRPIKNARVYILDQEMQPVPVGVWGELYIGGDGLARGYLRRPRLTSEKFVPHPFTAEAGARLYRTGDWGRYLEDGNIEFLRRLDQQVKVRGIRVELGEVEAALAKHPAVREVIVEIKDDHSKNQQLVAYVVSHRAPAARRDRPVELWPSVGEYQVYDELMYYAMTHDELRNSKYVEALNRVVKDRTVVEIGTGQDAILARFCVAAGAKKVYAIEALDDARAAAEALVERLGLADKIVLIPGYSFAVELPELVDVCVSELIGTIGGSEGTAAILNDARRFLKAGGTMVPRRCVTKISGVQLPDEVLASPRFTEQSKGYVEKIFAQIGHPFDVRVCLRHLPAENILSDEASFEDLDFMAEVGPAYRHRIALHVVKQGRLDGFFLWLNLHVAEDVVIDNQQTDYNWLPVYFPVFEPGLEVNEGDMIEAVCSAALSDNGVNPDYRIAGAVLKRGGEVIRFEHNSGHHPAEFKQTRFYRELFSDEMTPRHRVAEGNVSARNLRAFLSKQLPDYMIPGAFVELEELPLTPNGKVDRRALPAPEQLHAQGHHDYVPARTVTEELVSGMWEEVLGVERVGVGDDFFELGGHSLLATQVISRVRQAFGVEVALREMFEGPTVEELAQRIEAARREQQVAAPPIEPVRRDRPLPLSFAQQRLWFLDQLEPGNAFYNSPATVRLRGELNVEALERTLSEVVERHEGLRTHFATVDGQPAPIISPAGEIKLPVLDLSRLSEAEREAAVIRLADEEAKNPFDLSTGPLFRASLVRLGEREHVVLLTLHHIVSDGWSFGVLVREVATLYTAFVNGQPSPLDELPIQYADYAYWQRQWLQGEALEQLSAYWRQRLRGNLPVLQLPSDRPRPAVQTFRGTRKSFPLPKDITDAVQKLSRREGCTMYMTLLAGFLTLLHRYTRQEDLLIGSAIANRNRSETENLIGFFVNMVVLRTDLSGDPSFETLLKQVREVALGAYAHQDMPLEKLVEEFAPERNTNHSPLFQVAFGVQNAPTGELQLPGLTLSPVDLETNVVRFDLTLWMVEEGDSLTGKWTYSTDMFDDATISRMARHFETLLRSIVAQPATRLSALELLTEEEKRQQESSRRERDELHANKLKMVKRKSVGSSALPAAEVTRPEELPALSERPS